MRWRVAAVLAAAGLVAPVAGVAQEAKRPVEGTIDLGFVDVSGNSDVTTLNAAERLVLRTGGWELVEQFAVVFGRTDGVTSTSHWKAAVRADRTLAKRIALFGQVEFERNTFAGIARRFVETIALRISLLDTPSDRLSLEAGGSYTQERSAPAASGDPATSTSFVSAHGAARYKRMLGDPAYVEQSVEFLPNLEISSDVRISSQTALVAPLSKQVALKASYVILFDNLPQPGFGKTDRTFSTGVQVAF